MDFKSYKNTEVAKKVDTIGVFDNMPHENQEEMSQFISMYGGKSQEEILIDFVKAYEVEVEKGNMSKDKLRETMSGMTGFLTPDQLKNINSIIDKLEK